MGLKNKIRSIDEVVKRLQKSNSELINSNARLDRNLLIAEQEIVERKKQIEGLREDLIEAGDSLHECTESAKHLGKPLNEPKPQLCPVCKGDGRVSTGELICLTEEMRPCHGCEGKGWVTT